MLYLSFIFHMHQPYYVNLLTRQANMPWVRLHGIKDYLDMVQILDKYPLVHQTFNLVPSLIEQIEDYANRNTIDKFLELSYRPAASLNQEEKNFILENFFSINKEKVIAVYPRYYELYFKKQKKSEFTAQDYLDLQVWFNLSWTDPGFIQNIPGLKEMHKKARFFTEEDKQVVLSIQNDILKEILPAYKKSMQSGQIEVTFSPFYHPILPLLYNTNIAKEANIRSTVPKVQFSYPQDAFRQIDKGSKLYEEKFGIKPQGMWPSEESVSEHILPFVIQAGVNWIVADEAILFKSLKKRKRDAKLLYQPYLLNREEGSVNIIFRDRNLSDMIGFIYHQWDAQSAADDLMGHLKKIADAFVKKDILVAIAMDGENAWEYYKNDGHDFLNALYEKLSEAKFLKCVTPSEYLKMFPAKNEIKRLAAGSWIFADFGKWIGHPLKNKAWEYLAKARAELDQFITNPASDLHAIDLSIKQISICEGSDWFWWYGDNHEAFDAMYRMHLANFYAIIGKDVPEYLNKPLST